MLAIAAARITSRPTWLYFRSLRFVAAAALVFALALIGDAPPPPATGAAGHQALAILAALATAMVMAGFGAFFAVRH